MPAPGPIVVVGSINMDLVVRAARIPAPGETVAGSHFETNPGGKGANQAVAVARLGYPVSIVGRVGDDDFGVRLRRGLTDAGVEVSALAVSRGSSGVAVIAVSPSGENTILVTPGANAQLSPADLDAHLPLLRQAGMVLAQLEIPLPTVERLAEICRREAVPLMLDPAPAAALPGTVLGSVRWFTPNETEARFYLGGPSTGKSREEPRPADAAAALLALGPAGVVLKQGERGAFLADGGGLRAQIDAVRVHAIDTTGAGDAFNGSFAVALLRGLDPRESARFAAAAAALSVTRRGAQAAMPTLPEVERMLASRDRPAT